MNLSKEHLKKWCRHLAGLAAILIISHPGTPAYAAPIVHVHSSACIEEVQETCKRDTITADSENLIEYCEHCKRKTTVHKVHYYRTCPNSGKNGYPVYDRTREVTNSQCLECLNYFNNSPTPKSSHVVTLKKSVCDLEEGAKVGDLTLSASTTEWTNQPVTITASFRSDSKFLTAAATPYDFGSGATDVNSMEVSKNGTYTVAFTSVGGQKATESITIANIDVAPPSIHLSQDAKDWVELGVTVTVEAEDDRAGLAEKAYSYNGGDFCNDNTFWVTENGTLSVTVRDKAGNESSASININNIGKSSADELAKTKQQLAAEEAAHKAANDKLAAEEAAHKATNEKLAESEAARKTAEEAQSATAKRLSELENQSKRIAELEAQNAAEKKAAEKRQAEYEAESKATIAKLEAEKQESLAQMESKQKEALSTTVKTYEEKQAETIKKYEAKVQESSRQANEEAAKLSAEKTEAERMASELIAKLEAEMSATQSDATEKIAKLEAEKKEIERILALNEKELSALELGIVKVNEVDSDETSASGNDEGSEDSEELLKEDDDSDLEESDETDPEVIDEEMIEEPEMKLMSTGGKSICAGLILIILGSLIFSNFNYVFVSENGRIKPISLATVKKDKSKIVVSLKKGTLTESGHYSLHISPWIKKGAADLPVFVEIDGDTLPIRTDKNAFNYQIQE